MLHNPSENVLCSLAYSLLCLYQGKAILLQGRLPIHGEGEERYFAQFTPILMFGCMCVYVLRSSWTSL
jgi:hypothetical protein